MVASDVVTDPASRSSIRVVFCLREDAIRKPGGDSIQIHATAEALRRLGDSCEIVCGVPRNPEDFDVVNLTNLDRPHEMLAIAGRLADCRFGGVIALSTIHHPNAWTARIPASGASRLDWRAVARRSRLLRSALNARRIRAAMGDHLGRTAVLRLATLDVHSAQSQLLERVDGCLALSDSEIDALATDFGYNGPSWVVPNGISDEFLRDLESVPAEDRYGIAVVGRIERRKNSLALLQILEQTGLSAVFMGQPNANERAFCDEFVRRVETSKNVRFLGPLPRREVARQLGRARLHVLASYAEVFPLVDLEALASGCGVMTTKYSLSASLLREVATIVDPAELTPAMIREAHTRGAPVDAPDRIRREFTWSAAASSLRQAYLEMIANRHQTSAAR